MIEAGLELIEAGLADLRAEHAETEARLALLKAADALERAGDAAGATDVVERVKAMRERDREALELVVRSRRR